MYKYTASEINIIDKLDQLYEKRSGYLKQAFDDTTLQQKLDTTSASLDLARDERKLLLSLQAVIEARLKECNTEIWKRI